MLSNIGKWGSKLLPTPPFVSDRHAPVCVCARAHARAHALVHACLNAVHADAFKCMQSCLHESACERIINACRLECLPVCVCVHVMRLCACMCV